MRNWKMEFTLQARKLNLIEEFLRINDEQVISDLESLILKEKIKSYERELVPMTIEQFHTNINQSVSEIESGQFITHEELLESIKEW